MWEECLRHVICSNVQLCPISYLKVIFLRGSAELHPSNHSQLHPAAPRGYNNGWIHKGQIRVNWCCYCCSTPAPVEHLAAKQADSFLRRRWRPNKSSKTNDDWTVMNRNVALLPDEFWNIYRYCLEDVASVRAKHVFDSSGAEKATNTSLVTSCFENFHKAWWHSLRYIWVQWCSRNQFEMMFDLWCINLVQTSFIWCWWACVNCTLSFS